MLMKVLHKPKYLTFQPLKELSKNKLKSMSALLLKLDLEMLWKRKLSLLKTTLFWEQSKLTLTKTKIYFNSSKLEKCKKLIKMILKHSSKEYGLNKKLKLISSSPKDWIQRIKNITRQWSHKCYDFWWFMGTNPFQKI